MTMSAFMKNSITGSMYDQTIDNTPTRQSVDRQAYEEEANRRWLAKQYGFSLPQAQTQEDKFFSAMSKYMPQNATGTGGGNYYENRLQKLMDNPDSIKNSGAYRFAFDQGQQAIERSAAARGMLNSGNILAELAKYGQGMAAQQYDKEADRLGNLAMQREQNDINRSGVQSKNALMMMEAYNKMPRFIIA
jgi:hypothetical protein